VEIDDRDIAVVPNCSPVAGLQSWRFVERLDADSYGTNPPMLTVYASPSS
jgi:hypothetical protein